MKREDGVEDGWRRWCAYKMEEDGGVYVEGRRWHVQSIARLAWAHLQAATPFGDMLATDDDPRHGVGSVIDD
jgi:hypothetical protein